MPIIIIILFIMVNKKLTYRNQSVEGKVHNYRIRISEKIMKIDIKFRFGVV